MAATTDLTTDLTTDPTTDPTTDGSGQDVPPAPRRFVVEPQARVLHLDDGVLVRLGAAVTHLRGAAMSRFLTGLVGGAVDGVITVEPAAGPPERRAQLAELLARLVSAGLLLELPPVARVPDPTVLAAARRLGPGTEVDTVAARRDTGGVLVVGRTRLAETLVEACRDAGLAVTRADGTDPALDLLAADQDLVPVVVGAHEDDRLLVDWNAAAVDAGRGTVWLAVTPFDGEHALVGPWVVAGVSACHHCFRLRRAAVHAREEVSDLLAAAQPGPVHGDPSRRHPGINLVLAGLVVERLLEHLAFDGAGPQSLPGGTTTVAFGDRGLETAQHRVLRVPRCPTCSPARDRGFPQVWFARPADEDAPADARS